MLEIKDLFFRYSKKSPYVLNGVSLCLKNGETGVLLGKNGSGKTTVFKNILGLEKPEKGEIFFDEKDILKIPSRERAAVISYVPQSIRFGNLNVFDTVLSGRIPYFGLKPGNDDLEKVRKVLLELGLEELSLRNAEELSGGEQQKVAIARALVQEPELLIFDEPTGNLDIESELLVLTEAKKAASRGMAVLLSVHDLNEAFKVGDKYFFLKDGRVKYFGGKEIVTDEVIKDVFDTDVDIIEHKGNKVIVTNL